VPLDQPLRLETHVVGVEEPADARPKAVGHFDVPRSEDDYSPGPHGADRGKAQPPPSAHRVISLGARPILAQEKGPDPFSSVC
jgi:hypothetical protein